MPKRSSRPSQDPNVAAHEVVKRLTEIDPKDATAEDRRRMAAILGSRGGKKGGKARAAALEPEERSSIASKAARARWAKRDNGGS